MNCSFIATLLGIIVSYIIFPNVAFGQPIRYGVDSTPASKEKKHVIEFTTNSQFRYFPQLSGLRFFPSSGATSASIVRVPIITIKEKRTNYLNQAASLSKKGSFQKAILLYKLILKDNNLIEARLGLGYALIQTEAFSEAILEFDEVLKKDPNNVEAQLNRGVILYCLGNIDKSIEQYKSIKTDKKDYLPTINFNLALAYCFQNNFTQSEKYYLKAIEQKSIYPEAYNNLGLLYQFNGKTEEAIKCFRMAIKQHFDYYLAHYNLSGLLNEQLKFDEAINETKLAINQNSNFPEAYLNLGTSYLQKVLLEGSKDIDNAITAYRKALELKNGNYPFAHEDLAIALTLKQQLDEAFSEYRIAVNQYSIIPEETINNLLSSITNQQTFAIANELNRVDDKTKVKIRRKDMVSVLENAFAQYQSLDEELKNKVDIRYCLGLTYKQIGKFKEAYQELLEALKLSHNMDLEAKKIIEELNGNLTY